MTWGPAEPERITPPRLGEGAGAGFLARIPLLRGRLPPAGSAGMAALTVGSASALVGLAWVFRSA